MGRLEVAKTSLKTITDIVESNELNALEKMLVISMLASGWQQVDDLRRANLSGCIRYSLPGLPETQLR